MFDIKFPIVLKAAVGLPHKTDYGLVKANIQGMGELLKELDRMTAKLVELGYKPRFAMQEMVYGQEVLVSAITNEFGKVITYGLGGIFVEVMKDVSQKIAPITDSDIDEMLAEVKGTKVLLGARTKKKYDVESLKKVIKSLSTLVGNYPEIKEIEFNPVMVTEAGSFAVDAIVSLQ
jgi:acyl-CoA synthetase (NDP forming)